MVDMKEFRDKIHDIVGNKCSAFVDRDDCSRIDACISIEREIKEEIDNLFFGFKKGDQIMTDEMKKIKEILHYPECWDIMTYPTIESAVLEVLLWEYTDKKSTDRDWETKIN